eukprot:3641569-Rhodomonas_salina.1
MTGCQSCTPPTPPSSPVLTYGNGSCLVGIGLPEHNRGERVGHQLQEAQHRPQAGHWPRWISFGFTVKFNGVGVRVWGCTFGLRVRGHEGMRA